MQTSCCVNINIEGQKGEEDARRAERAKGAPTPPHSSLRFFCKATNPFLFLPFVFSLLFSSLFHSFHSRSPTSLFPCQLIHSSSFQFCDFSGSTATTATAFNYYCSNHHHLTNSMSSAATREAQAHATLRNLQNKKPVPEIDFTIHTMDDGTTASTLERYSKGILQNIIITGQSSPQANCFAYAFFFFFFLP